MEWRRKVKSDPSEGQAVGRCVFMRQAGYDLGSGRSKKGEFRCFCGKIFTAKLFKVKKGVGCGCRLGAPTHGQGSRRRGCTRIYNIWGNMNQRCRNPNHQAYFRYGALGVTVCERWSSFSNFYEDMGDSPSMGHSLDRKDNSKSYFKENCRWATRKEQCRNRRSNVMLTCNGETKLLVEWAEIYGIRPGAISHRLLMPGWSVEEAITTPVQVRAKRKPLVAKSGVAT